MAKYKVWVRLEAEYNDIEAEDEEEAFIIASDYAMQGGCWEHEIEELKADAISFNEPTHEGYAERCNHTQNEGAYDE